MSATGLQPAEIESTRAVFARGTQRSREVVLFLLPGEGEPLGPNPTSILAVRGIEDERAVEALADEL